MAKLTEAVFSMQCSFIAKNAAAWAGDILTLPEHYNREADAKIVARFTDEMRARLDRLDEWAGRSVPLPEIEGGDKGDGWQPIETAPSAHEAPDLKVLVFNPRWVAPIELRAADGDWWRSPVIRGSSGIPTHWRHLPAAPSASIEGETP